MARVSAVLADCTSTFACARLPTFFVPLRRLLRRRSISRTCLSRVRAFLIRGTVFFRRPRLRCDSWRAVQLSECSPDP